MAIPTFTLLHPEKVAANPADALVIASHALAALSLAVERVRVEDLDIASANGFRNLFDAVRGTMDAATEEVRGLMAADEATLFHTMTGEQCKAVRTILGWSQKEVALRIGCKDDSKISNFERTGGMHGNSRRRLARMFTDAGAVFFADGSVKIRDDAKYIAVSGKGE
jgi:hypothetical protein